MRNSPLSPGLAEQDVRREGTSWSLCSGQCSPLRPARVQGVLALEAEPRECRHSDVQPRYPNPCMETAHSPSQVDMSAPPAQQLPHQPSVLLDAVLNINLLLLQGNTALSPPALAAAPVPAPACLSSPGGLFTGTVYKSSGQHSSPRAGGTGRSSWINSHTRKEIPTPHVSALGWAGGRQVQQQQLQ